MKDDHGNSFHGSQTKSLTKRAETFAMGSTINQRR
jgi:hypothetical protein